jgi:hypothetical protein
VSLIFGISGSFHGPVKLCHVAVHTTTWQTMTVDMWQDDVVAELADHTLTWQGDCTVVDMAQWLAATWPSHGLPRGSGKMPNDNPRTKIQKK